MGQTKSALPIMGPTTASERALAHLDAVASRVIVLGHGEGTADAKGWTRLDDANVGRGPLAGVLAALESGLGNEYLVLPVDMPAVDADLLRRLLLPTDAPLVHFGLDRHHRSQPFPMRIAARIAPRLRAQLESGNNRVQDFLQECPRHVVVIPEEDVALFFNLNTPEDLARWQANQGNGTPAS
jgi:molybdopterin-guanine dinucleotide biosynthesis protein A